MLARARGGEPALNADIDAFVQAALAANMPLDVLNHPAGYHSFDVRTREIIRHTLAFLREHLEGRRGL